MTTEPTLNMGNRSPESKQRLMHHDFIRGARAAGEGREVGQDQSNTRIFFLSFFLNQTGHH